MQVYLLLQHNLHYIYNSADWNETNTTRRRLTMAGQLRLRSSVRAYCCWGRKRLLLTVLTCIVIFSVATSSVFFVENKINRVPEVTSVFVHEESLRTIKRNVKSEPDVGGSQEPSRVGSEKFVLPTGLRSFDDREACGRVSPPVSLLLRTALGAREKAAKRSFSTGIVSNWGVGGCKGNATAASGKEAHRVSNATLRRYALCYFAQNRFLFFGNNWGRHSNQLTSLAAALVLGRTLNRTIIVPPLFLDHKGAKSSKGSPPELIDLYDVSRLLDVETSPFCVLSEDEFFQLERERLSKNKKERTSEGTTSITVPAVCMTMRGVRSFLRLPKGIQFECSREVFVKYKKDLMLFLTLATSTTEGVSQLGTNANINDGVVDSRASTSPHFARVLTVPLLIYYAAKVPTSHVLCVWSMLRPHPVVSRIISVLHEELRREENGSRTSSLSEHSSEPVIGVHLRSLEGSCESRIGELVRHAEKQEAEMKADGKDSRLPQGRRLEDFYPKIHTKQVGLINDNASQFTETVGRRQDALKQQCLMGPSYILSFLKGHSYAVPVKSVVVLIADDNQQPSRVKDLVHSLTAQASDPDLIVRALRLRDVFNPKESSLGSTVSSAVAEALRPSPESSGEEFKNRDAGCTRAAFTGPLSEPHLTRNRFISFSDLLFMQLDFWSLVGADILVGNQLSTLSLNVCRKRRSLGLPCNNFVVDSLV